MKKFEPASLEEQRAIEVGSFSAFVRNTNAFLGIVASGFSLVTSIFGFANAASANTGEIKTKAATYKWNRDSNQLHSPIYFTY